jgi:hypothetical protein
MATISISVSGTTVATGARNYTINDGDLQSVLDWARTFFASALSSAPTNTQILSAWADWFPSLTQDRLHTYKRDLLAATATDISIS